MFINMHFYFDGFIYFFLLLSLNQGNGHDHLPYSPKSVNSVDRMSDKF